MRGFVLAVALVSGSCLPEEVPDVRREMLRAWGESFVLVEYARLEAAVRDLDRQGLELCRGTSTLEAARAAWWQAKAPLERSRVFAFGPFVEEPQRYGPKVDFGPLRESSVLEVLSGTSTLSRDGGANLGASQKGLPVAEYLLFGPGSEADWSDRSRRCAYLSAVTHDLVEVTHDLWSAWDPAHGNYLGELSEAGRSSVTFRTLPMAVGQVVNRMAFSIEALREDGIGKPLGRAAGGVPQPDRVSSRYSGRSLEDIADTLDGIEVLFTGNDASLGLAGYLRARGIRMEARFHAQLAQTRASLQAVESPLSRAIFSHPDRLETLDAELAKLQRLIQVDIVGSMSLSVGFSDNDGD